MAADFTNTMIIYVFREYTPLSVDIMNREVLNPEELGPDEEYYTDPTNIPLDNFILFAKHEGFRVASKSCTVISSRADGLTSVLPPLNKPHITLLITPLKISLIFLLEAIPEISRPSNWLPSLALVCAGSGVIHNVIDD
jgi:hypothetical protein